MKRKIVIIAIGLAVALTSAAKEKTLKLNRVADARARVWAEWVAAQRADSVLPDLRALSAETASAWVLPDSLEPEATMNFYYGAKGEAERYPLFIYLHGSGPRDREWTTGLVLAGRFDDAPSAYFIPQIPREGEWYRWYHRSKQWAFERLLRAALASGRIDPDRVYLMGISEGGYGSQRLASFYADYLAAAGPMAGGEPLKNAPVENLRNTAFSLRTGADDRGFYRDRLTGYTASALDSVGALAPDGDYPHWIELIPGRGHFIDYAPTPLWLKGKTRPQSPRRLTWEDFEMDGRHRSGFGCLQVLDRPTVGEGERTRYDLAVEEGNVIRLDARNVRYVCEERDPHWGIELKFRKEYGPVADGRIRIYLNEDMVDPARPVTLIVNGVAQPPVRLRLTEKNLRESCAEFGDPQRLFPASVDVAL